MPEIRFWPAGGAHNAPPDPLVGWGGGHPLSIPHPLDTYGVSIFASRISFPESWQPSVVVECNMLEIARSGQRWHTVPDTLHAANVPRLATVLAEKFVGLFQRKILLQF